MRFIVLSLIAYLLGSVPTGLIVSKVRGLDPRRTGSGNIGATNVLRTAGKMPALLTLLGDMAKGFLAVLLARNFGEHAFEGYIGLFAIIGHNFPIFLKFRGGKGVATSLGALLLYAPQTGLLTIIIWLMTVGMTKYSSLGALVSFGVLPASITLIDSTAKLPVALFMTVLIFVRHKDNLLRLVKGTEHRVGKRP